MAEHCRRGESRLGVAVTLVMEGDVGGDFDHLVSDVHELALVGNRHLVIFSLHCPDAPML